jgi:hypothetical protein
LLAGLLRTATGCPSNIPSHDYAPLKEIVIEINQSNLLAEFDVPVDVHHDKYSYNKTN